jgi:predicted acylesterase/phospholipase RssA
MDQQARARQAAVQDPALSFSGSGVLATFQAGVAHFINQRIGLPDDVQLLGTSGGAIVAVLLACDYDFSGFPDVADAQITEVRAEGALGLLHFGGINLAHMDRIMPPDAHTRCSGRCGISATRLQCMAPWRNARLSTFRSRADLLGAVAISSHAPGLYGAGDSTLPRFRGGDLGLDGGLTDNMPLAQCAHCGAACSARTVTVSPVDPLADIHGAPELQWFHVMQLAGQERLRFLFELGWQRAEAAEALIRRKLLPGKHAAPPCACCTILARRSVL